MTDTETLNVEDMSKEEQATILKDAAGTPIEPIEPLTRGELQKALKSTGGTLLYYPEPLPPGLTGEQGEPNGKSRLRGKSANVALDEFPFPNGKSGLLGGEGEARLMNFYKGRYGWSLSLLEVINHDVASEWALLSIAYSKDGGLKISFLA